MNRKILVASPIAAIAFLNLFSIFICGFISSNSSASTLSCTSVSQGKLGGQDVEVKTGFAQVEFTDKGVKFKADVAEGHINTVSIENLATSVSTLAYSSDGEAKTLSTQMRVHDSLFAGLDCDLVN